mgnify:CR=1 FL=1
MAFKMLGNFYSFVENQLAGGGPRPQYDHPEQNEIITSKKSKKASSAIFTINEKEYKHI